MCDIIVAPATPLGVSAFGVIRVSGPGSLPLFLEHFVPASNKKKALKPRYATLGNYIIDEGILDTGIAVYYPASSSLTGEDAIEATFHGNPRIIQKIIEVLCDSGARLAAPGEFTQRAFMAGKIDLCQAESIAALTHAESLTAAKVANRVLRGDFSRRLNTIKNEILDILAALEVMIDFPDEDNPPLERMNLKSKLTYLIECVSEWIDTSKVTLRRFRGVRVVICGKPNAGKSTLFNRLIKKERAIVHELPGTTRDTLVANSVLNGFPVKWVDTAGVHHTENEIEKEGIRRTRRQVNKGGLNLLVFDSSRIFDDDDIFFLKTVPVQNSVIVINKSDLKVKLKLPDGYTSKSRVVAISAKTGRGIKKLLDVIIKWLVLGSTSVEEEWVLNERQLRLLKKIKKGLCKTYKSVEDSLSEEFIAAALRRVLGNIAEFTGENISDIVLDKIFSEFCIGK